MIYTGRLHASKGILPFVKGFHQRKNIDAELLLAGDGPDYPAIEAICQNDSRITMLGHVVKSTLLHHMEHTNIFIFPSSHEGCPNALLEAMASRHACICYDIPPVAEVLGQAGRLIQLNDVEGMLSEVLALTQSQEKLASLADEACTKAASFSWDHCARSIERILLDFGKTAVPKFLS